jgi:hypothetical protein
MIEHELKKKADLWLMLHNRKDFRGAELECKVYCRYFSKCSGMEYTHGFIITYKDGCIKWLDDE